MAKKTGAPQDDTVKNIMDRIQDLKTHRSSLKCNPYDNSKKARSIEEMWDYADYVALPHKFASNEMQDWMSDNSIPLIMAKIDTAVSVIVSKNPEIELSGTTEAYEKKSKVLKFLYDLSWSKGGRQQLIKFVYNMAKYGFAPAREYHRFEQQEVEEVIAYHPEGKHETFKKTITLHDEPVFETLPIRDVYIDDRAIPFDEDSVKDWAWNIEYDFETFKRVFKKYNISKVKRSIKDRKDKADIQPNNKESVSVWFYENRETNEFIITDGLELIYKGLLPNGKLSLVYGIWKLRNDFCIYGIGVPEELEHNQTLLDRLANMTINQTMLAVGGAGFYGGTQNVTQRDMILEPRLKKLRDSDKINFPKIPSPDQFTLQMIEFILDQADEISGITKSLGGEQVGKTLGEAVLNREAGLRRLALPLQNLEFAMEWHARLRVDNIQLIYGRPVFSEVIANDMGVVNEKLWKEYQVERGKLAGTPEFMQKYPEDDDGIIYRNQFKTVKLPFEKDKEGETEQGGKGMYLEITPEEIRGTYDVAIKAMSTIPMSQTLREAQAMETFNLVMALPYTDLYKAQQNVLKARNIDPDLWMKSEEEIMETQEQAQMGGMMGAEAGRPVANSFSRDVGGQPMPKVPTSAGAIPSQISKDLGM